MRERLTRRFFATVLSVLVVGGALAYLQSWLGARSTWRRDVQSDRFVAEMPAPSKADRILVVAPHPDDELLGCGGLIQQAVAAGADVRVALMTNGDGSQWALVFGERRLPWRANAYVALGRKRQKESLRALSIQGLEPGHVYFLGYPNAGLLPMWRPEHWRSADRYLSPYTHSDASPYGRCLTPRAPYCGEQALADLAALIRRLRPNVIFVAHPQDIHPDHWATSCFVRYALQTLAVGGAEWPREVKVYGYLVHWPRYPQPRRLAASLQLLPPFELGGETAGWLRLPLTPEQVTRKLRGIRAYGSQEPGFDRLLLSFARRNESFELLPAQELRVGHVIRWPDPEGPRRTLAGAALTQVRFTVTQRLAADAEVESLPRPLPRNGYLAVDLRTQTPQGATAITTAYVRPGGMAWVTRLNPPAAAETRPLALGGRAGRLALQGLELPGGAKVPTDLFVTCWGSVRDRATDPAVATWLRLREAHH